MNMKKIKHPKTTMVQTDVLKQLAKDTIVEFAEMRGRGQAWNPEEAIAYAKKNGVEFSDQRNWGNVFLRVEADGTIKRKGEFVRRSSNYSVRPGWALV